MTICDEKSELTILSVSYHNRSHLRLNRDLTELLNPGNSPNWIVVENTPKGGDEELSVDGEGFVRLSGVSPPEGGEHPASVHHAWGLHRGLGNLGTRFALILDPDFFIVRPGWIADVLGHMKRARLAFFGAPWHPRWVEKYRYFPCVHCLFVATDRVPVTALDFRLPSRSGGSADSNPRSSFRAKLERAGNEPAKDGLDRLAGAFKRNFLRLTPSRRRALIGMALDTGSGVFREYHGSPECRVECLTPVFRPEEDLADRVSPFLNRLVEPFFPDRLSYVPKRSGSFSRTGFRDDCLPDARARGWEEHLWQGRPFAFHLRGTKGSGERRGSIGAVRSFLEELLGETFRPQPQLHRTTV